ncbi:MAG TPA: hypothetical protein VFA87_10075 [Rhizomicrobium sp.]|nr:hypothetical protein [Rhizomicrobium sp.]
MGKGLRIAQFLAALCVAQRAPAFAQDERAFSIAGYGDFRAVAAPSETAWLNGGLSKFRYGNADGNFRFAEAVAQGDLRLGEAFSVIALARAEPEQRTGIDLLEGYLSWHPAAEGAWSWTVKTGAFFPTISLENDDLGWTSPYTLTPSAINSWIGEELRTIGSEGIVRYDTGAYGAFSFTGALYCCNDPAGVLIADRGWAMDDRPSGLFSDLRLPEATVKLFRLSDERTPMFEEIDGRPGWYAGLGWQMAGIGKLTVLRYDNEGDPYRRSGAYSAWDTRFWSYGARTSVNDLVLIAQGLQGQTVIGGSFGLSHTEFQSAFLLASYDLEGVGLEDWRASLRGDVFQARHTGSTLMNEDGHAGTMALSWQATDWLRITGEWIVMQSRKNEYALAGFASPKATQQEFQLSAKVFF